MKISYGSAMHLEHIVRHVWGLSDRSHLHGRIDGDCFRSNPYESAVLILAPYVMHDCNVDNDSFVHSTMEDLYCLCSRDEYSQEAEEEIVEKAEALSTYLAEHYTPAK